jgi:hypothetical protein
LTQIADTLFYVSLMPKIVPMFLHGTQNSRPEKRLRRFFRSAVTCQKIVFYHLPTI